MSIKEYLDNDVARLEQLIAEYPQQIPVPIAAKFLGCAPESLRTACEEYALFGFAWRKPGKVNKAFCIPTAVFVRWYTKGIYIGSMKEESGKGA